MNFGYNFHDREMIRIIVFDINPPEIVYQNRGLAMVSEDELFKTAWEENHLSILYLSDSNQTGG